MPVLSARGVTFDAEVPVVIVGAGACGMIAALAAHDAGADAVLLERDPTPAGSTALSSGMIPACETRQQAARGVADTAAIMTRDVLEKAHYQTDAAMVSRMCETSGPVIDWLCTTHGLELTLVEGFLYPGHNRLRMHAPASRSGVDLMAALSRAVTAVGIPVMSNAHVTDLFVFPDRMVRGVGIERPDDSHEQIGCAALILACNGFGGNPEMVRRHIPDMAPALYFGHRGNQGDAVIWGQDLGAAIADLGAYQGHGSVAHPTGILISWALMMEGGIQINANGARFSNEYDGYSEQARRVIAQPGGIAWNIIDDRLLALGQAFTDFRQAEALGAVASAGTIAELAGVTGVSGDALATTIGHVQRLASGDGVDPFGRDFTANPPLKPPLYALKVTGALFHTQGGLMVDGDARVLDETGAGLPNLFAGGGAARGVSGPEDWGYLSGNGLLSAATLGYLAGQNAARLVG